MSYSCEITGKKRLKGHRVSHANNKTIHFQLPNLKQRQFFLPELGIRYKIKVSTKGVRTIDKYGGLSRYVMKQIPEKLSPRLQKLRKILIKKGIQ